MSKEIWLVAKTKMTSGPQKWDEGPNDTKYYYPETTHEVFSSEEKANEVMKELSSKSYIKNLKLYHCIEVQSLDNNI